MLASGRHASDRAFATGSRADQFQDKHHWPSVTYRVTRAGDEDTSIINVTYWCGSPQVTVDPAHGRRGHGRALIVHAEHWAKAMGSHRMSLTTYRDVLWNGPYYRRLGWYELAPDELGAELKTLRAEEVARGLDRWARTAMAKNL